MGFGARYGADRQRRCDRLVGFILEKVAQVGGLTLVSQDGILYDDIRLRYRTEESNAHSRSVTCIRRHLCNF